MDMPYEKPFPKREEKMKKNILEIKNLTKYFGQNKVLHEVNLSIERGKIHGLVGANGSGKSTIMNILFGNSVISETGGYEGEILLDGEPIRIRSTRDAMKYGFGMIHQEFILIPDMTVAENIKLTRENTKKGASRILGHELSYIDKAQDQEDASSVLNELGFSIDCSYLVKNLSTNAKQFVEIARELDKKNLKFLLLDEPTAVLNDEDSRRLMDVLKKLASKGTSILFCSHRLHEICELCDTVTVIRDGNIISEYQKENMSIPALATDMIGYDIHEAVQKPRMIKEESILSFRDFSVQMPGEQLHGIHLDVKKGEILGLTSLSGHGKLAPGYGVLGIYPSSGSILFEGENLDLSDTGKTIEKGIFLLPDDRKNMGLLLDHSIRENIVFSGFYGKHRFSKKLFGPFSVRDKKSMSRYVEEQIRELGIKCENMNQKTRELSGGNQQKVCIARAAAVRPKVLFISEPTRGVDIGAKEKILDALIRMSREQGTTIIVASSELEELKRISDRIAVLCEGKVSRILPPDASEEEFAYAYTGEEERYDQ